MRRIAPVTDRTPPIWETLRWGVSPGLGESLVGGQPESTGHAAAGIDAPVPRIAENPTYSCRTRQGNAKHGALCSQGWLHTAT